jgi:hypothetical protein
MASDHSGPKKIFSIDDDEKTVARQVENINCYLVNGPRVC